MTTGTYTEIDGRPAVRLVREFAHPVERVWATVTDPDELATWFPARVAVDGDLRIGATLRFTFEVDGDGGTGTVLDHRPPGRLAFTWDGDEVWFDLEPLDTGRTRLVLTNVLEARDTAARNGAGWEVCLDALARTADEGTAAAPDATPTPEWERHYDAYVAEGVPSGAPIPG